MSKKYDYDIIIIGSGPGGEGAAIGSAKLGARVSVIERHENVGGGCTHLGTIPSKTLRQTINLFKMVNNLVNSDFYTPKLNLLDFFKFMKKTIKKQIILRKNFYKKNNCHIFIGKASFIDDHYIRICNNNKDTRIISAKNIVIACGSRPYHPPDIDFKNPRILDSDSILSIKENPVHIIIYGAGVIGCEYASIFNEMNIKVDLINTRNQLLSFLDQEISNYLSDHFLKNGIIITNNEEYKKITGLDNRVEVELNSGKCLKANFLLYANGRTGNSDSLNLKNVGLKSDHRGYIKVNNLYQTNISHIFAIGDVIGYPSLASVAYYQGYIVSQIIFKKINNIQWVKNIPTGIYTIPEISCIGKTEKELKNMKIPYEIGRAKFKNLAKTQILGIELGILKILFNKETKKILGLHCFGHNASEIIHLGQTILEQKAEDNSIEYFINTIFNYPTMAEAYRVAAFNGLNKLLKL